MMVHATDREGRTFTLSATPGTVLMELLRDEGLGIEAICGGNCACATCQVYVDLSQTGPRGELEEELAGSTDAFDPERSRLSCQIRLEETHDGLAVTIAPED